MQFIYKNIYQVKFTHEVDEMLTSMHLTPTAKTQQLLNNYKILLKQKNASFYLLHSYKSDEIPLIPIEETLHLTFLIDFNYNDVITSSDLPLYSPITNCLYLNSNNEAQIVDKTNIVEILKSNSSNKKLLALPLKVPPSGRIMREGAYLDSETDKMLVHFSFSNNTTKGILDIEIDPDSIPKTLNYSFKSRQLFVQYVVFDRFKQYSNFKIINSNLSFEQELNGEKTTLTSTNKASMASILNFTFALTGERKNGREITLREQLPLPNLNNLTKDNYENFYVSAFIYV